MLPLVFTNYHRLSFSKIITRFNDKWLISVVSANDYLHSLTTIIASFCPQSTTPPIHSSLCTLPGTSTGLKDRKQSSVRNALLMKMMTNKSQVQSFWRCVDRHQLKARPPITLLNFRNCILKHVLEIQERNRWNGNSSSCHNEGRVWLIQLPEYQLWSHLPCLALLTLWHHGAKRNLCH